MTDNDIANTKKAHGSKGSAGDPNASDGTSERGEAGGQGPAPYPNWLDQYQNNPSEQDECTVVTKADEANLGASNSGGSPQGFRQQQGSPDQSRLRGQDISPWGNPGNSNQPGSNLYSDRPQSNQPGQANPNNRNNMLDQSRYPSPGSPPDQQANHANQAGPPSGQPGYANRQGGPSGQPGYANQPGGLLGQLGYANQPGRAAQPGYSNQPGGQSGHGHANQPGPQSGQPGHANQPGPQSGQPGYANQPGPQSGQPGYANQPGPQLGQPGHANQPGPQSGQPGSGITRKSTQTNSMVGTVVGGRFEILEVLGSGGMSVVFKARQLVVDRLVAIKTLKMQLAEQPDTVQRFQREIKSLFKLSHPNIVTVFDCIIEDSQPFIAMDYLSGKSLEELLRDKHRLTPEESQPLLVQICSALDHAHKHGIVHRDLKPSNIMLVGDDLEFVKVVDFGLARLGQESQKVTRSGEVWGSPPYMSPEQCNALECDGRSDIYSLGIVMYEMLTGADPFTSDQLVNTLLRQLNEPPPPFAPHLRIPNAWRDIVFKCLEKEPARRFQTMSALKDALITVHKQSLVKSAMATTAPELPKLRSGKSQASGLSLSGKRILQASLLAVTLLAVFLSFGFYRALVELGREHSTASKPCHESEAKSTSPGSEQDSPEKNTEQDGDQEAAGNGNQEQAGDNNAPAKSAHESAPTANQAPSEATKSSFSERTANRSEHEPGKEHLTHSAKKTLPAPHKSALEAAHHKSPAEHVAAHATRPEQSHVAKPGGDRWSALRSHRSEAE